MQAQPEQIERREARQPMRQFNHEAPKSPSLLHHQIEFWWYVMMPVLVIAAISAGGILAGIRYYQPSNQDATSHRSSKESLPQLDPTNFESAFLSRYIRAKYASGMNLSEKMQVTGTYANASGVHVFTGTFDFNGNGTFHLEFTDPVELEFADGTLVSRITSLYESEAKLIGAFINAMQDPILAIKEMQDVKVLKLEPTKFLGVDAYVAHIKSKSEELNSTLTISASSLTILEHYNHSTTLAAQRYRYSEYKMVDGVRLPHSISIQDQWGEQNRVTLSNFKLADEHEISLAKF